MLGYCRVGQRSKANGLFVFRVEFLPLVEAGGGDDAAPALETGRPMACWYDAFIELKQTWMQRHTHDSVVICGRELRGGPVLIGPCAQVLAHVAEVYFRRRRNTTNKIIRTSPNPPGQMNPLPPLDTPATMQPESCDVLNKPQTIKEAAASVER
jgi:hypothetical protein